MAVRILGDVFYLDLQPADKLILLALADNANDDGTCYPSQSTLALKTGYKERHLRDRLRELAEAGWMHMTPGNGRGRATAYVLDIERIHREGGERHAEARREAQERGHSTTSATPKGGILRQQKAALHAEKGALHDTKGGTPVPPNRQEPSENRQEEPEDDPVPLLIRHWESQTGKLVTRAIADRMDALLEDSVPVDWIRDAITETGMKASHPVWSYAEAILGNWKANGRDRPKPAPVQAPLTAPRIGNRVTVPDHIPPFEDTYGSHVRPSPTPRHSGGGMRDRSVDGGPGVTGGGDGQAG